MIKSNFKNKNYAADKDNVRIINPKQAAYYWKNGVEPLDIYVSENSSADEPIIVYVFSKKETQDKKVYDDWCKRKKCD